MAILTNVNTTPDNVASFDDLIGGGYAFESLSGIPFTEQNTGSGFGIYDIATSKYLTSRTVINTLDLVSEGQIEGLVSGEYEYSGNIGDTGYVSAEFLPFGGFPENQLRSIYLNEVPVTSASQNEKNYYNFQNFQYAFSDGPTAGLHKNDNFLHVNDSTKTQKTKVINERLYGPESDGKTYSKNFRIFNKNISSLSINIKIPALSYTKLGDNFSEEEQQEQVGTLVRFQTQYRAINKDGSAGAWLTDSSSYEKAVQGLISSPYMFEIKTTPDYTDSSINADILVGWEFMITRLTLDSINSFVQNESYVDSITEKFQSNLQYPSSAIIATKFDAEFFGSVPNRAFDVNLLKVKIPSNYDPRTRTYYSDWDGTFSTESAGPFGKSGSSYVGASRSLGKYWTDNPAWVFYDLVTNKRYGLGKYIESLNIDKWTLYKIAQYCDVLVDDGQDGVEPRFSCNVLINTREDAFKVLQDFASIFRGIVYYGMGGLQAIQDREKDPIIQFNNSNVLDGDFSYSSTAKKTRFSVAVVRYNDKDNFYKPALEYVEDVDAIRKYGIRETEITAFGCTSKGQAVRLGRWLLHTNNLEQETVNFTAGMDTLLVRPGDLIQISDKNRGLNLEGGRLVDISTTGVLLDRYIDIQSNTTYDLTITTPTFFYDTSLLSGDASYSSSFDSADAENLRRGQVTKVSFTDQSAGFSFSSGAILTGASGPVSGTYIGFPNGTIPANYNMETGVTWGLDNRNYEPEYYNVLDIRETSDIEYEVTASKHYTGKFAAIESGITFTPRDPNIIGTATPPPPPLKITGALGQLTTNSKKINYGIDVPTGVGGVIQLGTTSHYNVYVKTGTPWDTSSTDANTGDFIINTVPPIPRNELKIDTVTAATSNITISKDFIPATNTTYYLLCYAFNSVGLPSNSFVTGAGVTVSNHNPIRDVEVNNLRLTSDSAPNATANKQSVLNPVSKDQAFTWDVSFPNGTPPMDLGYRIRIRQPVNGNACTGNIYKEYEQNTQFFDFNFDKNYAISNASFGDGPYRHYDITVEAKDLTNGGHSTDGNPSNPTEGYDILEIHNTRPSGFWITPRDYSMGGGRPGDCGQDDLCTEQLITSDGKIRVHFRSIASTMADIAGGYIYLSKEPFSTFEDFTSEPAPSLIGGLTGVPANDNDNTLIGMSRYKRLGIHSSQGGTQDQRDEAQIISVPFLEPTVFSDCACDGNLRTTNTIIASPNFEEAASNHFAFDRAYHMAISLFDSFDYAISGKSAGSKNWNSGLWVGCARPFIHTGNNNAADTHQNSGHYTGANGALLSEDDFKAYPYKQGVHSTNLSNYVQAAPWMDGGNRSPYTGFSGCVVHPTKFTSAAGLSPYHAWIRMNVNGLWEGNGISSVRILNKADIDAYYDYRGFYEYQCVQEMTLIGGSYYQPNASGQNNFSCRFTQGKKNSNGRGESFGAAGLSTVGTTLTGLRVGVPQFWQDHEGQQYSGGGSYAGNVSDENITSYNETGAVVKLPTDATISATKPLHGFRRFRVYFDPNNLPAPNVAGQLASYTVLGINAWNGKYTAWPAGSPDVQNDLLFARDGTDIFHAGTVQGWLDAGDVVENIPGVWNHHPAGFGQGYGGLIKTRKYFDVHLGRLIDDSYLEEAFFGVVTTNDYTLALTNADWDSANWSRYDDAMGVTSTRYVNDTLSTNLANWYKEDY